ncbi:hypothetical protein EZV62_000400 [Acer yangbiense]|uniref:50S ribosomal protein L33, chloroplastic n=1 Tax=Acer yangbiense TaxID=1000413 RepID=A0A5C7IR89_9ROSI|nr:hypothetical protein EZV62_000400 [Acer yangbiense]
MFKSEMGDKKKTFMFVRLVSAAGTGFFYVKKKSSKKLLEKLEFRKYDPRVNRHVLFTEAKMNRRSSPSAPPIMLQLAFAVGVAPETAFVVAVAVAVVSRLPVDVTSPLPRCPRCQCSTDLSANPPAANAPMKQIAHYNLYGFPWALEIWAMEAL